MEENIHRIPVKDEAPLMHDKKTGRQTGNVIHIVGHKNDGKHAFFIPSLNTAEYFPPPYRVQPGRRFIQNQEIRMHGNHAGDGYTALLTAGKAERRPFGKCFIINPRKAHGALYSFSVSSSSQPWFCGPKAISFATVSSKS